MFCFDVGVHSRWRLEVILGEWCNVAFGIANTEENMSIEMLPEGTTDPVQSYGINTRINKSQAEANNSHAVPKVVVIFLSCGVEVKPHEEYVVREETNGKY